MSVIIGVTGVVIVQRTHAGAEHSVSFEQMKPDFLNLSHMVEVQASFQAVRVGKREYVFIPKLRSVCLLDRTAEMVRL